MAPSLQSVYNVNRYVGHEVQFWTGLTWAQDFGTPRRQSCICWVGTVLGLRLICMIHDKSDSLMVFLHFHSLEASGALGPMRKHGWRSNESWVPACLQWLAQRCLIVVKWNADARLVRILVRQLFFPKLLERYSAIRISRSRGGD